MVEGNHRVQQAQIRAGMSMAIRVLARQRAIKAVKQALQAQGRRKVFRVPMCEIVAMAEEYLAAHPWSIYCIPSKA
jgi:ElaB/YqjD/DUF883 family membrane-anchored ribosome-binding protein